MGGGRGSLSLGQSTSPETLEDSKADLCMLLWQPAPCSRALDRESTLSLPSLGLCPHLNNDGAPWRGHQIE